MKIFSSVHVDKTGSLPGLQGAIDSALENGAKCLLIFLCSEHTFDIEELPPLFSSLPVPICAGVFPGIIHDFDYSRQGALVCGFIAPLFPTVIEDIDRQRSDIKLKMKKCLNGNTPAGAIVFIDGQSKGIDNLVSCIYNCLGPTPIVVGGGAGYLDFSHRPCIITAEGCYKNAGVIISLPAPLVLGVRHGWENVAGPFLVTHASDNVIHSINYEPAFPFYKEIIEEHYGESVDFTTFLDVAKSYPLGMAQLNKEFLVRDPLRRNGDYIECAGSVPQNTMIYLLHSEPDKLIQSAALASKELRAKLSPVYEAGEGYYTFTIDCISRELFLGEEYGKELEAIKKELPDKTQTVGVLSLGEIASSSQGTIRFLNKSTVVGGVGR